jgi:hypothetical protein
MGNVTIESAAIRLTDTILGYNEQDLEETLRAIALDIGVGHIAYMRFAPDKSSDASLLTGTVTYSFQWQTRYFLKQYVLIDPVIAYGSKAVLTFDWDDLAGDESRLQRVVNPCSKSEGCLFSGLLYQQSYESRMAGI